MAYKTPTVLFDEFCKDWEAALCPDAASFALRCHPERQDELFDMLEEYMSVAPEPPYSPIQQRRLAEKTMPIINELRSQYPPFEPTLRQRLWRIRVEIGYWLEWNLHRRWRKQVWE